LIKILETQCLTATTSRISAVHTQPELKRKLNLMLQLMLCSWY
jgi:hypothetical protein